MEAMEQRCNHQMKIMELETQGQVKHIKDKWRSEFERRKKLHNALLELKGNIRVFCRIRPMLESETAAGGCPAVKAEDEDNLTIASPEGSKDLIKTYEFDRVFGPEDGQEEVFEEVSSLVTSVLDGYNVCIVAYGQTGSGKTYTMDGPEANPGVNSRTLSQLFRIADNRNGQNNYTIKASVLEIYNEQIVDLLSDNRDKKLDIKQDADGMYVPGLKIEEVRSMENVNALIATGKKNRSTFATNMNEHSSRSHLVFSVYVENQSSTQANGRRFKGKLHLIDLAGSERLSKSGAQGDRLREAQNINKSLSALGDVIQALRQKSQHIPFRNSKLTRFLEDSLGRSSKCLLMANFSPSAANCAESRCSAEFASRAKKVELGRTAPSAAPQNRRRPPTEQK
ncbi:hypothetical protein BSKO_11807 [Bryopsis sp. KO-2023]|nr:hypothetical protein BSKO_11807 [Bryopsis sp. KO-2023]